MFNSKKKNKQVEECLLAEELFTVPRYKPRDLNKLCNAYKFSKHEVRLIYQGFKQQCPSGVCNEDTFKCLFGHLFPLGDATRYAHYVFKTCRQYTDRNTLNFENFLNLLSCISRGSLYEKIRWIFDLYDINKDGFISRKEMYTIVDSIYEMLGRHTIPSGEIDESNPRQHVDRVFAQMDTNNDGAVSFEEFVTWFEKDEARIGEILMFDTNFG